MYVQYECSAQGADRIGFQPWRTLVGHQELEEQMQVPELMYSIEIWGISKNYYDKNATKNHIDEDVLNL